jgi:hypothetical protein
MEVQRHFTVQLLQEVDWASTHMYRYVTLHHKLNRECPVIQPIVLSLYQIWLSQAHKALHLGLLAIQAQFSNSLKSLQNQWNVEWHIFYWYERTNTASYTFLPATNTYNSRGIEWKNAGSHTFLVLLWIKNTVDWFLSGITEDKISS